MNRKHTLANTSKEIQELFKQLKALKSELDANFLMELKRSLPMADLLFDRWERANLLGFGKGTSVYDSCHVFGDVQVGENTWIGPFTILDGTGGLQIGSTCSISAGVHIYTHNTISWATSGGIEPYEYAPVVIGNRCYIGPKTTIGSGISLGDGCIVGAHSFVNKNFPKGSKIAGSPARLIST